MAMDVSTKVPFYANRLRSYLLRLPLFTRCILILIVLAWIVQLIGIWDVLAWGALTPSKVGLGTMHRLNTYPFIHLGFLHMLLNVLALTPLLERFEAEYGTLTSVAMFFGPISTFPGGLYILIEKVIVGLDNSVAGASGWVFLLSAAEAIKSRKSNPHFTVGKYRIPTWTTPLIMIIVVSLLVWPASFLGHVCSVVVGYALGLGYLKILFPPEKALRWVEGKLNPLAKLPHYVSVDQKTYGRYGILPSDTAGGGPKPGIAMRYLGSSQRLGP
ncbi:hypothetical protein VTO42DRAFT_7560 [Malbranchea cinnamomea]